MECSRFPLFIIIVLSLILLAFLIPNPNNTSISSTTTTTQQNNIIDAEKKLIDQQQKQKQRENLKLLFDSILGGRTMSSLVAPQLEHFSSPTKVDGKKLCTLLLLAYQDECLIDEGIETFEDCISKIGIQKWKKVLHPLCVGSDFFQKLLLQQQRQKEKSSFSSSLENISSSSSSSVFSDKKMVYPQDYIKQSQIISSLTSHRQQQNHNNNNNKKGNVEEVRNTKYKYKYIPPQQRTYAKISTSITFQKRRSSSFSSSSSNNNAINNISQTSHRITLTAYPISFGIPRQLILDRVSRNKFFSMSPLLAGWLGGKKNYPKIPKHRIVTNTRAGGFSNTGGATQQKSSSSSSSSGYTFNRHSDEIIVAQLYRHSYFTFTMFRGGTDCMRHLEILSRGGVPYFPDIELRCGSGSSNNNKNNNRNLCLSSYPKDLLREALKLPGIEHFSFNNYENYYFARGKVWLNIKRAPMIQNWTRFDKKKYFELADKLLDFTKKHLSCGAIFAYLLKTMKYEEPKNLLLVVPEVTDYLSICLEAGANELGLNYTTNVMGVVGGVQQNQKKNKNGTSKTYSSSSSSSSSYNTTLPHFLWHREHWPPWQKRVNNNNNNNNTFSFQDWEKLYTKYEINKMYGKGFTYGMRVNPPPNPRLEISELKSRILHKEFDVIVFSALFLFQEGRFHSDVSETLPLLKECYQSKIPFQRVAFVDTDDIPLLEKHYGSILEEMVSSGSKMFVREPQLLDPKNLERLPEY